MIETRKIIRIAAKGDGVTEDGAHFSGAVTGDMIDDDGTVQAGPNRAEPPCQHFGRCGGCQLQQANEEALKQFVTQRVLHGAEGQGVTAQTVLATHLSPPKSRRRAILHGMATKGGKGKKGQRHRGSATLGFKAGGSHQIIDLVQCDIIHPELFSMIAPLRAFIAQYGQPRRGIDIELTLVDQGVDCAIKHMELDGLEATEAVLEFAKQHGLARLSMDWGYGAEAMWEPEPVTVSIGDFPIAYPSGAFLQATSDAQAVMIKDAVQMLEGAENVADLFSGLGTFAFALPKSMQCTAYEAARDAYLACQSAAQGGFRGSQRPVTAVHRDLFRNPLQAQDLREFDAVILDPPRAGAREQIAAIADSGLTRVVYISCNPASWARDAKRLVEAGFTLETLRPVGQFRWSTHVELVSYFTRGCE